MFREPGTDEIGDVSGVGDVEAQAGLDLVDRAAPIALALVISLAPPHANEEHHLTVFAFHSAIVAAVRARAVRGPSTG